MSPYGDAARAYDESIGPPCPPCRHPDDCACETMPDAAEEYAFGHRWDAAPDTVTYRLYDALRLVHDSHVCRIPRCAACAALKEYAETLL